MRDRSLFAVVLAIVAGVFFWPGNARRAEQSATNVIGAAGAGANGQSSAGGPDSAGTHGEASHSEGSRHGGAHPHVSSAMLLLLADYLALDPHSEAGSAQHVEHEEEAELTDAQADRLSDQIRGAAEAGGVTIEPLIATLPDPVESHAKWMFDRYLDGLARGVAASGYVMDRFGPESWWSSGSPHGGAEGRAGGGGGTAAGPHHHEGEPGVILFRTTNGKRVLVVLLVTETATGGLHAHATMTALDSAANLLALQSPDAGTSTRAAAGAGGGGSCCTPTPERTLKFVGPTFSGSSVSLRTAVDRWLSLRTDGCWGLRIVSGSISSTVSRNTLGIWDKRITFQATVPDDDAMQDALFSYVKQINGGHGERVAWIVEDNTTFGASLNPTAVSRIRTSAAQAAVVKAAIAQAAATQAANEAAIAQAAAAQHAAVEPGRQSAAAAPGEPTAARPPPPVARSTPRSQADVCRVEPPDTPPEPRVRPSDDFQLVVIPFPMHVSRLHGAAEDERAQARNKNALAPQAIVPLRLADSGSPRDAFPAMTPELTFASVDRALAALLDTIHSEHIRLVSIMATDTRDKLFLAEQIAQRAPDALLFTFTTDILLLHPDVNDNVRGMLVASAYPLNPVTQPWTPHDPNSVLQMQHNTAQGIYNATIAVLGAPSPDSPVSNNFAPLLDYGAPGPIRGIDDEVTGPAIWVSSVGRDTFWPVAIYDMRNTEPPLESFNDPRLIKVRTTRVPRYPVPHLSLSPWACALFVGLSVLALLHVRAYALAWWRERPTRETDSSVSSVNSVNSGNAASAAPDDVDEAAAVTMTAETPIVWNDCNASHRRAPVTVYQLVCVIALWTVFTVPVTLSVIWLKAAVEMRAINVETPVSGVVIAWLAALLAVVTWVCLTAVAGALILTILRRSSRYWWRSRREPRGWPTTVRLLLWVIGVIAIGYCAADVLGHLPMTEDGLWAELPYFMRATTLGNGVSPVVTYFLLSAAFYAWGVINLRRFETPTPMLCAALPERDRPRDWRIPLLRGLGFDDPEELIAKFQCRCTDVFLAVPAIGPLAALASAVAIYVVILGPTPLTIEGPTFGMAVVLAMIVLHVITGLAVYQFYLLWRTLHSFLEQLSHDGLLDAFETLGRRHVRVISAGISLRGPRDIDHFLADHAPALAQAMAPEAPRTPKAGSGSVSAITPPTVVAAAAASARRKVSPPSAWAVVTSRESRESFPPAVFEFLTQRAATSESQREDVTVATLLALAIQQILTRLGELLAFATAATLLVIAAFGVFPFGRGPVLDGFGWLYVFILASTALLVFIQVARDPILGRLRGYEKPGAINWDREIMTKFVLYAGVPLFGFISSQFPWLGRLLTQWLQPLQQALPWQ